MTSISFSSHGLRGHGPTEIASAWGIDPNDDDPRIDGADNGAGERKNWLTTLVRLLPVARAN